MDYSQGAFLCALLQVVLCRPAREERWFSVPRRITALEGSCVVIPCRFKASPPLWDSSVAFRWCQGRFLWWLRECPAVYDTQDPALVLPQYEGRALLVGDLIDHSCTLQINNVTREDADDYYPMPEWITRTGHRQPYRSVSLEVSGTPTQPTVTYPQTMTEGVPVAITCSVEHTCPAHPPALAWDKIHSKVSVYHEELLDGIWRTVLLLNYTPAAEHHMEDFVCSSTYPSAKSASKSIRLSISYTPKGTQAVISSSSPSDEVNTGDTVSLQCLVNASNPAVSHYTWYKDGSEIHNQSMAVLRMANVTTAAVGHYSCMAHNEIGPSLSSPHILLRVVVSSGSSTVALVTGVLVAVLAAAAIGAILLTRRYLKNKKKKNVNVATQLKQLPHDDGGQNLYENVDNVYATLDTTQTASEYEDI